MRHEHLLLSETESRKVIDEVNAWCRRTGTNYNKLVTAARVAPCIRSVVRDRGRRMSIDTAGKLRSAMRANPHGISRDDHRARVRIVARETLDRQRQKYRREYPARPVDQSTCSICGARLAIGCEHHPRFESGSIA